MMLSLALWIGGIVLVLIATCFLMCVTFTIVVCWWEFSDRVNDRKTRKARAIQRAVYGLHSGS